MREVGTPGAPEGAETYAYSLEEVTRLLLYLPQPAYTIAAVAAFGGLRRSELAGLLWENYNGSEIWVTRSVWEGHVNEPKTRKSKAPVPVIAPLAKILDAYRGQCGNPTTGVMFASGKGTPLNLNNVLNRAVLPVLRKAGISWHGWHAFRRGLATNLHRLGVQDKGASDSAPLQRCGHASLLH
jgi:integrase